MISPEESREPDDALRLVAAGYDAMGDRYTAAALKAKSPRSRFTRHLLEVLAPGSLVLDLGCGAGRPTLATLAQHFNVVGVDISSGQIGRAHEAVPTASLVLADMATVQFRPATLAGVAAFYSMIHVPRERQAALLESVFSWLKPGGLLVMSMASKGSVESVEDFFGAPMYWSSFDAATNQRLIRDVGFSLETAQLIDEETDEGTETHLWIVARRPGAV